MAQIPDKNLYDQQSSNQDFDFGQIFRILLMQSKVVIFIILLGSALAILNYTSSERIYKINSLLQIYSNQSSMMNPTGNYDFVLGASNTADIENIQNLYKSRSNLIDIIENEKINIHTAFKKEFIKGFNVLGVNKNQLFEIDISFDEDNFYVVSDADNQKLAFEYGVEVFHKKLILNFSKPSEDFYGSFKFTYTNPEDVYKLFRSQITVNTSLTTRNYFNRSSGLIEVQLTTNDPEYGIKILDYANELFISKNIEIETENARKAIEFLDERILEVEEELANSKQNLKQFKEENQTIDVDLEVESLVASLNELERTINETSIEISSASNNYTSSNPIYVGLLDKKDELTKQKNSVEQKIRELPLAQQEYFDLFRNVEITQDVYSDLMNKKLEYSIKEASTLGNIRVVDNAYQDSIVSPQILFVMVSIVMSVIFAITFAIIRGMFFIPISNPAELADRDIHTPIVGVIPVLSKDDEGDSERFDQSIESLIVNIKNLNNSDKDEQQKRSTNIIVTSPTPSNGKSFASRELSKKLSSLGHKVLLLDFDLKRGDQNKEFNLQPIDARKFISLSADDVMQNFSINENLYFLPRIRGVNSSFQFFYSEEFEKKIAMLENEFDYIVIDTAPLLSVSDTSILMSYADICIGVVRHGLSKINEVKQMISISEQIGTEFSGFVYNAYERPSSYYGYYGFYGNYAYQYYAKKYLYNTYDYKNEK